MKVWLEIQREGDRIERRTVQPGNVGIAEGACPACKVTPFEVLGGNMRTRDDRTYMADGRCARCSEAVGYIYAEPDTIFGIEEDNAVLHGRPRVY